ncbi:MAG: glycoside hydrolase family 43 protein [Marinilabiliaceae bacterium]
MYKAILSLILIGVLGLTGIEAQNPIIQTKFTADPAPLVHDGTLYLYTTHDEDESTWFTMNDWLLYSTDDMVNWTDHGAVLSYSDFSWGKINAWAPQCIERNGKFYMYVPLTAKDDENAIGVAVADSPYGPFKDPLGEPLVQSGEGDIDPSVFIDDDGQAYLYWGNPKLYYVKLNEDMISYEGDIVTVPNTVESFGKREDDPERPTTYEEGPWLYERDDLYYLLFAGGPLPEHIGYSTSESPTGPWEYQGVLMPSEGGAFTNHPAIIDYKENTYFFYHNAGLPGGGGFNRSVCVQKAAFNDDGTMQQMEMKKEGIQEPLDTLNPYIMNEAETIAWSEGVKSMKNEQVGVFIKAERNNAYTKVRNVDFREEGPSEFAARVGSVHRDVSVEIRIDSLEGELIGTLDVPLTGGSDRWAVETTDIEKTTGIHDLYFVFKGEAPGKILYFDYWRFSE